ncbi:uncharacterized protein LOC113467060 [Diaphorina citri]|uniref:Uncharacterized protein LOC113467060 n=1 Tax=Diaphorina citri TaxID=121845 RepID=A0A3Q0IR87_DIACI|nr:uncharacterized protein LOC113467060 [Diaphorina citri]
MSFSPQDFWLFPDLSSPVLGEEIEGGENERRRGEDREETEFGMYSEVNQLMAAFEYNLKIIGERDEEIGYLEMIIKEQDAIILKQRTHYETYLDQILRSFGVKNDSDRFVIAK